MKRRINFTNRIKIKREQINITLIRDPQTKEIVSFDASINLNGMNLPSDAKVYVEAYYRTEAKRYDFGTVSKIEPISDTKLADFAYRENLKFRVIVVDIKGKYGARGLILAHADRIRPTTGAKTKSILPVEFSDLGKQVWKVKFEGDEDAPILVFNETIPNIQNIAKTDPQFIMLVYPAVLREVLMHMFFVDRLDSTSDPSAEWQKDWLEFAKRILPGEEVPKSPEEASYDNKEDIEKWVEKVVEEFCNSRKEWDYFIKQLSEV
ncbi:MAG: hypothetical protein ACP5KW_08595 [Thermoproteota archaeon]|jgi:hypothetical protein